MKHLTSEPTTSVPGSNQPKRHALFDKRVLMFPLSFPLLLLFVLPAAVPFYLFLDNKEVINSVSTIVGSILLVMWYQFHFRKELGSIFNWSTLGMVLVAPGILLALPNLKDIAESWGNLNPIPVSLLMAAAPGISEEIVFRGIPISNWMRVSCTKRGILPCILLSGVVFGVIHGLNGMLGADVPSTVFQVGYATCLGVFLAAVFLRGGSLWPCILLHTLIDFTAFLAMDLEAGGLITEALEYDLSFYATVIASVILLVLGIYMVRPSKQGEIVSLWEKMTHRA